MAKKRKPLRPFKPPEDSPYGWSIEDAVGAAIGFRLEDRDAKPLREWSAAKDLFETLEIDFERVFTPPDNTMPQRPDVIAETQLGLIGVEVTELTSPELREARDLQRKGKVPTGFEHLAGRPLEAQALHWNLDKPTFIEGLNNAINRKSKLLREGWAKTYSFDAKWLLVTLDEDEHWTSDEEIETWIESEEIDRASFDGAFLAMDYRPAASGNFVIEIDAG